MRKIRILISSIFVCALAAGVNSQNRKERAAFSRLPIIQFASGATEENPDPEKEMQALVFSAERSYRKQKYAQAKQSLDAANLLGDKVPLSYWTAKASYLHANISLELKGIEGFESALGQFLKAEIILKNYTNPDSKNLLARILSEKAINRIIYAKTKQDYGLALSEIQKAYSLTAKNSGDEAVAVVFAATGIYFFYQTEWIKALTFFEAALPLLEKAKDHNLLLLANAFLIRVFDKIDNRGEAISRLASAKEILAASFSRLRSLSFFSAAALIHNANGNSAKALDYYQKARAIADNMGDSSRLLFFQQAIGNTYLWQGNYLQAEKELRYFAEAANRAGNSEMLRLAKILLGSALGKMGKQAEAQRLFEEVSIALPDSRPITKYNFYVHYADFLAAQNRIAESLENLKSAKNESSNLGPSLSFFHLESSIIWLSLRAKRVSMEKALKELDKQISGIKNEQIGSQNILLDINYLDEYIYPFRLKTQILADADDLQSALLHNDSYKSRWLVNKMSADRSFGIIRKDWVGSNEAKKLRKAILEKVVALDLSGERSVEFELPALLKSHEEKLLAKLDASSLAGKMHEIELSKDHLATFFSNLGDKAIISYAFTPEGLVAFVVRKGSLLNAVNINIGEIALKEKINKWRQEVTNRDMNFKAGAKELYDLLIKPAASDIKGASELILIPEGILWKIPFQALIDEKGKYVVQDFPLSYAPSLKALQTLRERPEAAFNKNIAGFGNPLNPAVKPLPESEKEIKNLALAYPSGSYQIREKASETALKAEMQKADILHLAVHGKLNEAEPLRSALKLAKDEKNDGNFEIEEIIGMAKSPRLVILSACSTSDGQAFSGEGLLSLSWAFLVAGSKSVVGTQWDIDDRATTEQMADFHKEFSKGKRSSEALRFAALRQIEKKGLQNHPFYWAGFVALGAI